MLNNNFQKFLNLATDKTTRVILQSKLYDHEKNIYFSSDMYRMHIVKNNTSELPRHYTNLIVDSIYNPTYSQKEFDKVYTSTPFMNVEKFIDIKNHRSFPIPSTLSLPNLKEIKKAMLHEAKQLRDSKDKKIKINSHFKYINISLATGIIQYESSVYIDTVTGKEKDYKEYPIKFTPISDKHFDTFTVNINYLIDAIQYQSFESTNLFFKDSLSPIIFDDINTLSLIMPAKI